MQFLAMSEFILRVLKIIPVGVVAVYVGCCERFALRVDVISAWV